MMNRKRGMWQQVTTWIIVLLIIIILIIVVVQFAYKDRNILEVIRGMFRFGG